MRRRTCHRMGGFTLLEMLVALVLLALFSIASYRALDSVLTAERLSLAEMARWRQLALAFGRIQTDLGNAVAGVAGRHGLARSLQGSVDGTGAPYVALDRLLPVDQEGGVVRIGYRFQDGALLRRVWREGAPATEAPTEAPILEGLRHIELRYLDPDGHWQVEWSSNAKRGTLPRAVEMQMHFDSEQSLRRVFLLQ